MMPSRMRSVRAQNIRDGQRARLRPVATLPMKLRRDCMDVVLAVGWAICIVIICGPGSMPIRDGLTELGPAGETACPTTVSDFGTGFVSKN